MSLTQTLTRRRDADLLQRALEGDAGALADARLGGEPAELAALLRLAREIPRPGVTPDADFVATLRDELLAEARRRPLAAAVDERAAEVVGTPVPTGPRTVTVPRGGRLLAGLATIAVLLAVAIGGLSTRALPGDALYPVKLMIGDAQVRLAGNDLARGQALLRQMDARLDEVAALVAAGDPPSTLVDEALVRASDDLGDAQRELVTTDSGRPDLRALQTLADAGAQATGRLAALRDRVPLASVPAVDRLLQQLAQGQAAMLGQLDQLARAGACGPTCTELRTVLQRQGDQLAGLLGSTTALGGPAATTPGGTADGSSGGTGLVPGGALPTSGPGQGDGSVSVPGITLPGVTVDSGGLSTSSDGGVTATAPGATASLPGVGVTVPSVTLGLPETSSTGLPLPEATVPESTSTVGGATVPVPGASVGGDCVIGLGDLCLGG